MTQETIDFVNNCILSFVGILLFLLISGFLWWFIPFIIREIKDALKNGAVITCNHFSPFDNYIIFHCIRK